MGLSVYGTRAGLAQGKTLLKCVQCGHYVLKTNCFTHFYMATPQADVMIPILIPDCIQHTERKRYEQKKTLGMYVCIQSN